MIPLWVCLSTLLSNVIHVHVSTPVSLLSLIFFYSSADVLKALCHDIRLTQPKFISLPKANYNTLHLCTCLLVLAVYNTN